MKRTRITILLCGLLALYGLAGAQGFGQAQPETSAKKVTITLVRWPYT